MKIVFISNMLPSGHYSERLCEALNKKKDIDLIVYATKGPENLNLKTCGKVKTVWSKNWKYIFQILIELQKDKPDVVHIQQEVNMYGGIITAVLFPVLLLCLKFLNYKVVTTIHAAVFKKQIDKEFISFFLMKKTLVNVFITPFTLKAFFQFLFTSISLLSERIITHTNILKEILIIDYCVNKDKVVVIPPLVELKDTHHIKKDTYFFYFGYMVRRKGLEQLLDGFSEFLKKFPNYKLLMAGGTILGQEQARVELEEYIRRKNLQNIVTLKGFIENKDLAQYYPKALATVIPGKISMGASGQLYHAQGYGKCILASNIGNFREEITHMKDGILVDNDKWAEALELVATDKGLVIRMENGATKKAQIKSPEITATKHLKVYKEVAE